MAAEDAGGSGDLAILVNTEMIILKGAVKAAASAGSVTGKVVNKALLSPFRLIQFCMKLHHRLSLYKNNELFSHHTFQNNQKNAESLFCVS